MQVREIMTPDPACCTPDSSLQEVARMMREHDCGCIPVVNNLSEKKPIGTITDRDVTIRTLANNQNPMTMKASDIMTSDIATISPETTLEECFDVMEDREIRRVLVVDRQGKCCGIVAQADVVQSGVNPIRTNRVIREISESSPSRHQAPSGGYRSYVRNVSSMGSGSFLPILVGLGTGVALMYVINNRQSSGSRRSIGAINDTYESRFVNAGDHENFGKYTDAEQEIEKRQSNLKDRLETARTQTDASTRTGFSSGSGMNTSFDTGATSTSSTSSTTSSDTMKATFTDTDDETVVDMDKRRSARGGGNS